MVSPVQKWCSVHVHMEFTETDGPGQVSTLEFTMIVTKNNFSMNPKKEEKRCVEFDDPVFCSLFICLFIFASWSPVHLYLTS